ncbi:uncharacterized protein (DUF2461 family) [Neorhizobium huautlense]|uniref:Uncharacterized protein (DUF2461 family) n=1 Tax=Neorhizobium huautlense TaxID=67774 RepID=A0ABT9Q175_9HYPH|nr:uncharacterized protein (DUF2461 family) [Neorhizobium huautlense]
MTRSLISEGGVIDPRIIQNNPDPRRCLAKARMSKGNALIAMRVSASKNAGATYFLNVSSGTLFCGGGALKLAPRLARILRQTIASHTGKWRTIVEGPVFARYFPHGLSDGYSTSTGYAYNHDALNFFSLRHFGACRSISSELLTSPRLIDESIRSFAAARPLVDYINRSTSRLPEPSVKAYS